MKLGFTQIWVLDEDGEPEFFFATGEDDAVAAGQYLANYPDAKMVRITFEETRREPWPQEVEVFPGLTVREV